VASQQTIDSFIVNAHYRAYEIDGRLSTTANTPAARHQHDNNHSLIKAPDILLNTATSGQWHITARHAIAKDTEHLVFYGNVQLKQISTDHAKDKTIATPRLNFSLQTHIASTTAPVSITQPGTHIDAQGMRADLNSGIITLTHHPQGTYQPNRNA
jgi:LPS export ABC transporter protein LptC